MAKIGQAGSGMFLMTFIVITIILTSAIKKDTFFIHFPCSFFFHDSCLCFHEKL